MKKTLLLITSAFTINAFAQLPSYFPTNGLVAAYTFDGNANDMSGNSNNGTVNGATLTTDRNGNANSAYSFNGTTNFISVSYSTTLNTQNFNGFSISVWCKLNTLQQISNLVSLLNANRKEGFVLLYDGPGGVKRFSGRATSIIIDCLNPTNTGQWYNLVLVSDFSANQTTFFVDGILQGKSSNVIVKPIVENLFIGKHVSDVWGSGWYANGAIDDIAIYNRALTQTEITQLYTGCTLTATVTPQSTTTFCQGDSVSLKANTGTNYTYKWYNNGNIINNATGSSYSATQSGSYTVKTDSLGCSGNSSAVAVMVNTLPVVSINSIPNSVYANSVALLLSGNPAGGTFLGNGVSGNSFTPKNAGLGTKHISYKYTDGNTCSGYASATTIVTDTTGIVCTKYDTVTKYISVTDTLIIKAVLTGIASPNNINMLKVFPNPTNDKLFINTGNYAVMNNYTIKITTMLGQEVFNTKVTKQEIVIDLNTLGSKGIYFFELYDGNNNKIEARKIILQ